MLCRFDKFLPDEMPTMKQITNKEYEEWQKYKAEKAKGHILVCPVNFLADLDRGPVDRDKETIV